MWVGECGGRSFIYHMIQQRVCRIKERGVPALIAGGAVRDHLLGLEPTDYDVAAGLGTSDLLALFPGSRQMQNAVGTVEVVEPQTGSKVEVTPLRNFGPASASCFWEINRARCAPSTLRRCRACAPPYARPKAAGVWRGGGTPAVCRRRIGVTQRNQVSGH